MQEPPESSEESEEEDDEEDDEEEDEESEEDEPLVKPKKKSKRIEVSPISDVLYGVFIMLYMSNHHFDSYFALFEYSTSSYLFIGGVVR